MPRYELKKGTSNKFWEITLKGKQVTTHYGRIGSKGRSTVKKLASTAEAKRTYNKLITEKTRKGYKAVPDRSAQKPPARGGASPLPPARNPDLEARLIENPDDVEAYLVYADFLQARGDPRGELIMLQHTGKKKKAADLIARHAEHFLGPLQPYTKALDRQDKPVFHWHLGFIRAARLSYDCWSAEDVLGEMPNVSEGGLREAVGLLLSHPSGVLLQDLLVPMNMLDDGCYFEPVCDAIAEHRAPALRRLRMGEYLYAGPRNPKGTDYNYEISWTSFGDISGLWKAVPRLEHLVLCGCMGSYGRPPTKLGRITAPRLQHLEIMSGGIDSANTRAIAAASWPELRHLDLWFGSSDYGFSGGLADIKPILNGTRLPKLEHLGLMNAEFTDELCAALPRSKILGQLKELSLALGTMSDHGAEQLAQRSDALEHLELLDLEHNFLSATGKRAVKGLCKKVLHGEQSEPYEDIYEEMGGRYVSVSE
jgi:uncharacterized protein (TIGR02996 family)